MRTKDKGRTSHLDEILKQAEHNARYMMSGSSGSVPVTVLVSTPEEFMLHVLQAMGIAVEKAGFDPSWN